MSQTDLDKLLALAADRSSEARRELFHAIVDFFLPDRYRLTEQQRALMSDVLTKLLKTIEMDVRRNLAEMLLRSEVDLRSEERRVGKEGGSGWAGTDRRRGMAERGTYRT